MTAVRASFVLCLLTLASLSGRAATATISPAEIQPGMKGYGLSVFHGTTIERFDVEAVGVLPFADLDDSWIMIRVLTGPVAQRNSGVIAGMSGSPVYFGDRLAGAVAFGFPMPKENVCFLQPVGAMLRALDLAKVPMPARAGTTLAQAPAHDLAQPVSVGGQMVDRIRISPTAVPAGQAVKNGELTVEPLATPLCVSGLGANGIEALGHALAPYRMLAAAVPSGREGGQIDMQPGSAVGVLLVDGDVRAAATGTVTWRDGDRLLAFGHPMMQRGRVAMPICGAKIVDFFNGVDSSFKLSVALDPCGTLDADSRWGVAGRLGPKPVMVPIHLAVRDPEMGIRREWSFRVIDDPQLGPVIGFNILRSMVEGELGTLSKVTFNAHTTVKMAGFSSIDRHQSGFIAGGPGAAVLGEAMNGIQLVLQSPFEQLNLSGVDVDVELSHQDRTATMVRASFENQTVKPGEDVIVNLDLRKRSDGSIVRRKLTVPIPLNTQPGRYKMGVAGGSQAAALDGQLGIGPLAPTSTRQLLARLADLEVDDWSLVAKMALPTFDLGLRGERLPGPPVHLDQILSRGMTTDLGRARTSLKVVQPLDLLVTNGLSAEVAVVDPVTGELPRQSGDGGSSTTERAQPASVQSRFADPLEDDGMAAWTRPPLWLRALQGEPAAMDLADGLPLPDHSPVAGGGTAPKTTSGSAKTDAAMHDVPKSDAGKTSESSVPSPSAARGPRTWLLHSAKDFAPGDGDNIALRPEGELLLGFGSHELAHAGEPHILAADVDKQGTAWLGTGNDGRLLKLAGDKVETVWSGDEPIITAVTCVSDGVLFATAPDGKIRKVGADGKVTDVVDSHSAYVWKLLPARDGTVLVATGRPAVLYRLKGQQLSRICASESDHFLALAEAPNGTLYLGGGMPARVWRWDGTRLEAIAAPAEAVTALVVAGDGGVSYAAGPLVTSLDADGRRRDLATFTGARVLSLVSTPQGLVASASLRADGSAALWLVDPKEDSPTSEFEVKASAITALVPQADGAMLAVADSPVRIYRLTQPFATKGSYVSPVLDATGRAVWGTFDLGLGEGSHGSVTVEARSGDSSKPGDDWSGWMPVNGRPTCPEARYLQTRLTLQAADGGTPRIDYTKLMYALRNTEPKVSIEAPVLGLSVKGRTEVRWKITEPQNDPVITAVYARAEGSPTWIKVADNLAPGLTSTMLDPAALKLKDGTYRIKVVADDGAVNPTDPRLGEAVSDPFVVDQSAPVALLPEKLLGTDGVEFRLQARDNLLLASIEWRVDGKPWRAATPSDGLVDSATELATIKSGPLAAGKHTLEVRVRDAAGNETVVKRDLVK